MSDPRDLFDQQKQRFRARDEQAKAAETGTLLRKFGEATRPPAATSVGKATPARDAVEALIVDAASTPRLLLPSDVATLLGVGVRTLERWRGTGEGPRFVKLSTKTIRYTDADVAAFVAANVKANTAS